MTTTNAPRTVAEITDDIRRYNDRLHINCVKASSHWYAETQAKLDAAKDELDAAEADAAWAAAVNDITAHVSAKAGAR